MRLYRISIGQGEALQYVEHAAPTEDFGTAIRWTHERKRAGEFLRLGASRIVSHLLAKGCERVIIEEVE